MSETAEGSDAFEAKYDDIAVRANTDHTSPALDKHQLGEQRLKVDVAVPALPVNNANHALVRNGGHQEGS